MATPRPEGQPKSAVAASAVSVALEYDAGALQSQQGDTSERTSFSEDGSSGQGETASEDPEGKMEEHWALMPPAADRHDRCGESGRGMDVDIHEVSLRLYCSHFLSRWGDRMWEFAVALFMVEIWPDSLLLAAVYGLVESASVAIFGIRVGSWVDASPRLKCVRTSLWLQNGCVAGASLSLLALLLSYSTSSSSSSSSSSSLSSSSSPGAAGDSGRPPFLFFFIMVAWTNILGGIGAVAGMATNIAVERDWVTVITSGHPPSALAQLSAGMRRIDLACKLMAPVAVGAAIQMLASPPLVAGAIAAWNVVSGCVEYHLLHSVFCRVPALADKRITTTSTATGDGNTAATAAAKGTTTADGCSIVALSQTRRDVVLEEEEDELRERSSIGLVAPGREQPLSFATAGEEQRGTDGHRAIHGDNDDDDDDDDMPLMLMEQQQQQLENGSSSRSVRRHGYAEEEKEEEGRRSGSSGGGVMRRSIGVVLALVHQLWDRGCEQARQASAVWAVYSSAESGILLPAVALACLYFTVLSFGTMMTAALAWRGVPELLLGVARGCGAAAGILATFTYPRIHARIGGVRTGLWGVWLQWLMLALCVGGVFVESGRGGTLSSALLMTGVVLSRFGLWTFDLAISQIMQEGVAEHERGVVWGVQNVLQELMELGSFALSIVLHRQQDFGVLVCVSYAMVTISAFLYTTFAVKRRGHLFHFEKLVRPLLAAQVLQV